MRKRIYEIIEPSQGGDRASLIYDIFMLVAIVVSLVPLMFMEDNAAFRMIEHVSRIGRGFKIVRITRLLRILRIIKAIRYSSKFRVLGRVLRKERSVLLSVLGIAVFYVFLTALIMFNAEPHINPVTGAVTFQDFFDALYWATVTLTTVGYGDMIPATDIGRFISMVSSLFGVAIIALPSGVITASYIDELKNEKRKKQKPSEKESQS